AGAIGGEGDAASVGGKTWLDVEGGAGGDPPRRAPLDGQQVEVAEEVEDDLAAVGAHAEVHPRPLRRREADGAGGAVLGVDVPLRLVGVLGCDGEGEGGDEQ